MRMETESTRRGENSTELREWPKASFRFRLVGAGKAGGVIQSEDEDAHAPSFGMPRRRAFKSKENLQG
jgi:hypothetical protein